MIKQKKDWRTQSRQAKFHYQLLPLIRLCNSVSGSDVGLKAC